MLPYETLLALRTAPRRCAWTEYDAILYALGIGMCPDGLDPRELRFVTERDMAVVPSYATAIGLGTMPGAVQLECDPVQLLHAAQALTLHRPIPPAGSAVATSRITNAIDKGDRGALVFVETEFVSDEGLGLLATLTATMFALDGGGIGGPARADAPSDDSPPARKPDLSMTIDTRPDQALLYRLSGDFNLLHSDPAEARRVGFERPILHGLCTYGIGMRALLACAADYRAERIAEYSVRFAAPVFPGERLTFDMWQEGEIILLEGRVAERGATVIRNGRARLTPLQG